MTDIERVFLQIDQGLESMIGRLQSFLRQPSVSATGEGIEECADLTGEMLRELGAEVRLVGQGTSGGNPLVYGRLMSEVRQAQHLLLYCLYDVVPADEPDWTFAPFGGARTDGGRIVGRGACNTKGPLIAFLAAVRAFKEGGVPLPVHLHFVIEGEEEIGSPNLPEGLRSLREDLSETTMMFLPGVAPGVRGDQVELMLGFKGMLYIELEVSVRDRDVHSRTAPILENAAWCLVHLLNTMVDNEGEILVQGFVNKAKKPTVEELALVSELASKIEHQEFLELYGSHRDFMHGLRGKSLFERYIFSPTLNISGLRAGYLGQGAKTINPGTATAKIDIRLLPGMEHREVLAMLQKHVIAQAGASAKIRRIYGYNASQTSPTSRIALAARNAAKINGYESIVYPIAPGSAPWSVFPESLGHEVEHVWQTSRQAQARVHGPDEFIRIEELVASAKLHARFLSCLAEDEARL